VRLETVEPLVSAVPKPLPADPGVILSYDHLSWRQPEFELFSWNRFPQVLIFDTASYEVQNRMFKRLAFFVEKKGFRGQLVELKDVQALHGYNAHDYRAEDLARFYQQADAVLFKLNQEEEHLRQILLENGILRPQGETVISGRGTVLSISRGSDSILRAHLLTHELFHGILFSEPRYRQGCFDAWDALSEDEQAYWLLLLSWVGYDINDPFLVTNEFQAYLFQQNRDELAYYFQQLFADRLRHSYPERAAEIDRFLLVYPHSFHDAYDRLQPLLRDTVGLSGGSVADVHILTDAP
jgi:hypothetical protein